MYLTHQALEAFHKAVGVEIVGVGDHALRGVEVVNRPFLHYHEALPHLPGVKQERLSSEVDVITARSMLNNIT